MSDRIYKINELIKTEVSQILAKKVAPEKGVLTVTAVETTNDLRQAIVWLSFFESDTKTMMADIEVKSKEIQKIVNQRLSLRHVPRLIFKSDKSGEYADKINKIFKNI